eukprot:scaffold1442_cov128-Cylindrotheca_fusiformis.AAC.37
MLNLPRGVSTKAAVGIVAHDHSLRSCGSNSVQRLLRLLVTPNGVRHRWRPRISLVMFRPIKDPADPPPRWLTSMFFQFHHHENRSPSKKGIVCEISLIHDFGKLYTIQESNHASQTLYDPKILTSGKPSAPPKQSNVYSTSFVVSS